MEDDRHRRAAVGVGLILLDTTLGAMKKLRIPPLAVGIGIYLPMSATFAVIIGAVLSHWYEGRARTMPNPERALATGDARGVGVDRRREHLGGAQRRAHRRACRTMRRSRSCRGTLRSRRGWGCSGSSG